VQLIQIEVIGLQVLKRLFQLRLGARAVSLAGFAGQKHVVSIGRERGPSICSALP
jgi:hypothetical protein